MLRCFMLGLHACGRDHRLPRPSQGDSDGDAPCLRRRPVSRPGPRRHRQGWRSWNAFYLDINEQRIYAQAEAMVRPMEGQNTPLSNAGFRSIGIDDGWQACGSGVNGSFHNAHGVPLVNESRFPDLARLNAKIHALGLKSGWYLGTTAGATSCSSVVARTCSRTPRPLARMTLTRRRSMDAGPPTISPSGPLPCVNTACSSRTAATAAHRMRNRCRRPCRRSGRYRLRRNSESTATLACTESARTLRLSSCRVRAPSLPCAPIASS